MSQPIPQQVNESVNCKHCGSTNTRKYGLRKGVQNYFCNACRRKFNFVSSLFRMKTPANQVSSALNMYYSGMSINAIREFLHQEHENKPSSATIYEWVDKYTDLALAETKDCKISVGDKFVADETMLTIDGRQVWFWDCIDAKTRFLLASRITLKRTTHDAQMLMEQAAKRAGKIPKVVVTDKLHAYMDGVELAFGGDTEHIRSRPFQIEDNTNLIERFHSSLKSRTKVMRGLKSIETAMQFTDGWLVHYNYFRPHESLKGKKPAEVAKADCQLKNWIDVTKLPDTRPRPLKSRFPRLPREKLPKIKYGRPRKLRITPPMPQISPKVRKLK